MVVYEKIYFEAYVLLYYTLYLGKLSYIGTSPVYNSQMSKSMSVACH